MTGFDFHTHTLRHDAIVNRYPGEPLPEGYTFSVGIHPWHAAEAGEEQWRQLEEALGNPAVVAVGECGLDNLRGPSLDIQTEVFVRQVALSEKHRLPMTIHCVRAWNEIIALHRRLSPTQRWTIHGFRGKPGLARQLLDEGFDISLGPLFNPATAAAIPPSRLHRESDEQP